MRHVTAQTKKKPVDAPSGGAYSRLAELMQARNLTVGQLNKDLADRGYRFNPKTIYRLASDRPLETINASVVRAVCETLDVEIGNVITWEPPKPKLRRVDPKTQKRLDYLMARANEGLLTPDEQDEMDERIVEMEALSMENARILAEHHSSAKQSRVRSPKAGGVAKRPKRASA